VADIASPRTAHRFLRNYESYLRAVVKEAKDRETRHIPTSVEEYLELRRLTAGLVPSLDMILLPLDIPDHLLDDPRIKELEFMVIDMVVVANVSLQYCRRR
jgi:hypothetical protein